MAESVQLELGLIKKQYTVGVLSTLDCPTHAQHAEL